MTIDRRTLLALLAVGGASAGSLGFVGHPEQRRYRSMDLESLPGERDGRQLWLNWSYNRYAYPGASVTPASEDALARTVRDAPGTVRVAGSGHSFSDLVPTDDTLIFLGQFQEVHGVDPAAGLAEIDGGVRIWKLVEALEEAGVALPNLPDISEQTIAGSIATATHGSGMSNPCMSAEVRGLRLVLADGSIAECSPDQNADLFRASQVAMGMTGVISRLNYRVEPLYWLRQNWHVEPYRDVLADAMNRFAAHDMFEFFYVPFSDRCLVISHDRSEEGDSGTERPDEDETALLIGARDVLGWSETLRRAALTVAADSLQATNRQGVYHELLTNERPAKFNEMEYFLPVSNGLEVLDQVITILEAEYPQVFFPIEVRYIKGDDVWLSPFNGEDRISISLHRHYRESYEMLFTRFEPIFKAAGGRPHWGKLHSLTPRELDAMYPNYRDFLRVRREVDPQGKFLNPTLRARFGVDASAL